MKQTIQKSTNLDQMLLSLVSEGAARYELFTKDISELQDDSINELFELTLDVLGDNKRGEMNQLPKEKKVRLIKQLLVVYID